MPAAADGTGASRSPPADPRRRHHGGWVTRVSRAGRRAMDPERPRSRRAVALTALGTVLPGAGLTQTRSRWIGWGLLTITLAAIAVAAQAVLARGVTAVVLDLASRPEILRPASLALALWGLVWCASIVLTAVEARPRTLGRGRTWLLAAFTTVMVVVVGGGTYVTVDYALITSDTVGAVFSAPPARQGVGDQVTGRTGDTGDTGGADAADPWAGRVRVNLLLLGSDAD